MAIFFGDNMPFAPSAQVAKNVGMTIKCHECGKSRLLYSKNKLKLSELDKFKRLQNSYIFVSGGSLRKLKLKKEIRIPLSHKKYIRVKT